MIIALPPAIAPPLPGTARRSCPWHGTARWRQRVQYAPALAGRPGHTHTDMGVAVRLERAHTAFLGQGQSLLGVGGGQCTLRGLTPHRNVTEETEDICLCEDLLSDCLCNLQRIYARARRAKSLSGSWP